MSKEGSPEIRVDGTGLTVVIVAGRWHEKISGGLIAGAQRALRESGASYTLVRVPGSFELPVVAQAILRDTETDAVVALGVIIRGGTPHFEYVADAATSGLTHAALATGKAIGFGVLTVENEHQGLDRAGLPESTEDKGREAAEAALATAQLLHEIGKTGTQKQ